MLQRTIEQAAGGIRASAKDAGWPEPPFVSRYKIHEEDDHRVATPTAPHPSSTPLLLYWYVCWCAAPPLPLGERGDQFPAEVWTAKDDAHPTRDLEPRSIALRIALPIALGEPRNHVWGPRLEVFIPVPTGPP